MRESHARRNTAGPARAPLGEPARSGFLVALAFYDINRQFVVESGEFEIMVGNSSRDEDLQKVVLTVVR